MSANASLGWSVSDAEVMKSFQKMQAEQDKLKNQLAQVEAGSKRASDTWAAGLRTVSEEQRKILQGQQAWDNALSQIGGRYRTLKEVMLDTSTKGKASSDVWAAGLRTISAQQQPILERQDKWRSGLERITLANRAVAQAQRETALSALRSMTQTTGAAETWADKLADVATNTTAAGMATSALTLAVGVAVQRYADWTAQVTELGRSQAETNRQMVDATRNAERPAEVQTALRAFPGVVDADAGKIFDAVERAAPEESQGRKLAIARVAAQRMAAGSSLERTNTFAAAMADLAGKFPAASMQRLSDVTTNVEAALGDKFAEVSGDSFQRVLGEMQASGMQGEEALALMVGGRQSDVNSRTLEQLGLALASREGLHRVTTRAGLTEEQKLQNEFRATATGSARLRLLQSRPDIARAVLGEGYDTKISQLTPAFLAQMQQDLAREGTFAQRTSPRSEAEARAALSQATGEFAKETGPQRVSADIGFARERLKEFYQSTGMPKWQIEGVDVPFVSANVGGKLQVFDAAMGKGLDPELAAIAMLRADLKSAGPATTRQGLEAERNAQKIIELLQKIHDSQNEQRQNAPAPINKHNEPHVAAN